MYNSYSTVAIIDKPRLSLGLHALSITISCGLFTFSVTGTGILLPKFRWHRSRWGRFCPVELANGNMLPGRMEFAVGYTNFCEHCVLIIIVYMCISDSVELL